MNPFWRSYFSNGLKPPTRTKLEVSWPNDVGRWPDHFFWTKMVSPKKLSTFCCGWPKKHQGTERFDTPSICFFSPEIPQKNDKNYFTPQQKRRHSERTSAVWCKKVASCQKDHAWQEASASLGQGKILKKYGDVWDWANATLPETNISPKKALLSRWCSFFPGGISDRSLEILPHPPNTHTPNKWFKFQVQGGVCFFFVGWIFGSLGDLKMIFANKSQREVAQGLGESAAPAKVRRCFSYLFNMVDFTCCGWFFNFHIDRELRGRFLTA